MTIISFELVSLLISIAMIINLKLTKKFLLRILKGTKIYLPITDQDYNKFNEVKKEKSAQFRPNGVVRICELEEYITVRPAEQYHDVDIILFFFLASSLNLIMNEGKNLLVNISYFNKGNESNTDADIDVDMGMGHNFNIASSFSLITITYTCYILYKYTFDKGYKSYDAKLFCGLLAVSFICFLGLEVYFPEVLGINYEAICDIINTRMSKLVIKADPEMIRNDFKFSTQSTLKLFFAFMFALSVSVSFKSSERISYFDVILNAKSTDDTQEETNENVDKVINRVRRISKTKQILNLLLLFLMIDPLLKDSLVLDFSIVSEVTYTLVFVLPLVLLIFILEILAVRYSSMLFLQQNYYEMLRFYEKPNKDELPYLRLKMNYLNAKFWEVFLQIFAMFYLPFIIFFFYVTRCNLIEAAILNPAEYKTRTGLIDSIAYVQLLAILVVKSIIANTRTFLNQVNRRDKSALII